MGDEESSNTLYFFFAVFFAFFLAALGTVFTSELLIGSNLYLKFAKAKASRLINIKPNIMRLSTTKELKEAVIIIKGPKLSLEIDLKLKDIIKYGEIGRAVNSETNSIETFWKGLFSASQLTKPQLTDNASVGMWPEKG